MIGQIFASEKGGLLSPEQWSDGQKHVSFVIISFKTELPLQKKGLAVMCSNIVLGIDKESIVSSNLSSA